jgi:hypothetical protein
MLQTRSARARALRSVRGACYAGLDSVTLREEVARRIREAVPADGYSFATIDPDTGLFTDMVCAGIPPGLTTAWVERIYPDETAPDHPRPTRRADRACAWSLSCSRTPLQAAYHRTAMKWHAVPATTNRCHTKWKYRIRSAMKKTAPAV